MAACGRGLVEGDAARCIGLATPARDQGAAQVELGEQAALRRGGFQARAGLHHVARQAQAFELAEGEQGLGFEVAGLGRQREPVDSLLVVRLRRIEMQQPFAERVGAVLVGVGGPHGVSLGGLGGPASRRRSMRANPPPRVRGRGRR